MFVIQLIVILTVIGLLLYLVNRYVPMEAPIKKILNVVVFIALVLWLLEVFGVLGLMSNIHFGR
jgi:hypothetical protein